MEAENLQAFKTRSGLLLFSVDGETAVMPDGASIPLAGRLSVLEEVDPDDVSEPNDRQVEALCRLLECLENNRKSRVRADTAATQARLSAKAENDRRQRIRSDGFIRLLKRLEKQMLRDFTGF